MGAVFQGPDAPPRARYSLRLRRALPALVFLLVLCGLAGITWLKVIDQVDDRRGRGRLRPSKPWTRTEGAGARLQRHRAGGAGPKTSPASCVGRGFAIVATDNDPLSGIRPVDGAAEVRYGPAGARAAALVRRQVPGATMYKDAREGTIVDLVLGDAVPAAVHRGRAGPGPAGAARADRGAGRGAGGRGHVPAPSPSPQLLTARRLPAEPGRVPVRQLLAARRPGHAGRAGLRPGLRRPVRRHGVRGPAGLAGRASRCRRTRSPRPPGALADRLFRAQLVQPGAAGRAAALPVVPAAADRPRPPPADPDPRAARRAPVAGGRRAAAARPGPGRHLEPAARSWRTTSCSGTA